MENTQAKYYKMYYEDLEGEGFYYCEVINTEISRQLIEVNQKVHWATPLACSNEHYDFTDQPEFNEQEQKEWAKENNTVFTEITPYFFETIWTNAKTNSA